MCDAHQRWGQEDQQFRAILSHTAIPKLGSISKLQNGFKGGDGGMGLEIGKLVYNLST